MSVPTDGLFELLPVFESPLPFIYTSEERIYLYSVREYGSYLLQWKINGEWVSIARSSQDPTQPSRATFIFDVPRRATIGTNEIRALNYPSDVLAVGTVEVVPVPDLAITLNKSRGTVGINITAHVEGAIPGRQLFFYWRRPGGSTVYLGWWYANLNGAADAWFKVPATEGGSQSQVIVMMGGTSASVGFEVVPRIKILSGAAYPGESVTVSLRGYGKQETVRIRWLIDGSWVELGAVQTSNTGSAWVTVTVPSDAAPGPAKVRGDGPQFRAQTNAFIVLG